MRFPNNYLNGYKKAVETGGPWIVVISEDWCGGCIALKQTVSNLEQQGYSFNITWLKTDDKYAKAIVEASKRSDKNYIPFWHVWQYKDGKFVQLHVQVGAGNAAAVLRKYSLQ